MEFHSLQYRTHVIYADTAWVDLKDR